MPLFDDKIRTHLGPANHTEGTLSYLDRSGRLSAKNIRDLLNDWFDHHPDSVALRQSFQNDFDSAFFELFIHELFRRNGFQLTPHPTVPNSTKTPDYLVEGNGHSFYLEATLARDISAREQAENAIKNNLFDYINDENSPNFFIWLRNLNIPPGKQPSATKFKAFLKRNLESANADALSERLKELGFDSMPIWKFEDDGITIDVQPIPKSPELRGQQNVRPIGFYPIETHSGSSADSIKNAILRKCGRYGPLDRPYIVAVNSISPWGTDHLDIEEALYGPEQMVMEGSTWIHTRKQDGAFVSPGGPQCTRISGVLIAWVFSTNIASSAWYRLFHNQYSTKPIQPETLTIRQAIVQDNQFKFIDGLSLKDIFQLPDNWPDLETM